MVDSQDMIYTECLLPTYFIKLDKPFFTTKLNESAKYFICEL